MGIPADDLKVGDLVMVLRWHSIVTEERVITFPDGSMITQINVRHNTGQTGRVFCIEAVALPFVMVNRHDDVIDTRRAVLVRAPSEFARRQGFSVEPEADDPEMLMAANAAIRDFMLPTKESR